MTAKQIAVKRYVVMLSDDERERLDGLMVTCRQIDSARLLDEGTHPVEGWTPRKPAKDGEDSQIAAALDTSIDTVARTRQQLVEEGLEAVLVRKHSPASARPRIFDGAAEAKLIALASFPTAPKAASGGRCSCWRRLSWN